MKPKSFSIFIHFDDADPAGILFFANYFRLAHRALELNLEAAGISWGEWFNHPRWGVPLRHVEADYQRPIRAGERIDVVQWVHSVGNSSAQIISRLQNAKGEPCAVVKTTHVFIEKASLKKMDIPSHLKEFLNSQLLPEQGI